MKKVNIIIADDHLMFLEGINTIFKDMPEIGEVHLATEGKQVLRLLNQFEVHLIISDISMPKMDGIELLTEIKKKHSAIKIIILSMLDNHRTVHKVIQKGADGFVPKFTSKEELQKAVRTVLNDEQYFSDIIKQRYMESVFERKKYKNIELSPREKEVLALLGEELTSKEISEKLFISVNTVETHRKNILLKTDSKTTTGAVKYAIESGLFDT
ncbi:MULTISPECIES: response regulator transcription factor [Salegentibacter]|uniref:Response regulator transcription factor n=1 Tax=Salegentibacter maritimus TaxID=2794347 RepID=A0ABS0TIJ8_9FLAO|nr:response regulator transcription factor [Salegentibacter maritimus]MBE7639989.1 response regulator [Salegentibacter sp. BLCTC]MBI6116785.1 response regulator transcription factor [Salegentibacter maritimus]MBI6120842.1 response regulator transcription factor [Salegentibacter maritimus]